METKEAFEGEADATPVSRGSPETAPGRFCRHWWRRPEGLALALICSAAFVLSAQTFARWLVDRPLDMDEMEFVRATKLVAHGKVPYLQFWEHHFPLQWYLMAPLTLLAGEAGVESFRVMRLGNAGFVAGSALLAFSLASLGGRRRWPAAVALLLLLSAQYFAPYVVTYRIDGPMCFFYLLGVYLLERSLEEGNRSGLLVAAAGVALAFSGLSSQRAIPGVVIAVVVYLCVRPGERWGVNRKVLLAAASGAGIAVLVAASWAGAGALGKFWNQNVVTNGLYERLPAGYELPSFWRAFRSFFVFSRSFRILGLLAAASLVLAVLRFRRPTFAARMGILAGAQLVFLASISSPFSYQQQLLWWLIVPLSAVAISTVLDFRPWPAWASPVAALVLLIAGSGPLTWGMTVMPNFRAVQAHQDHVLRRLEEVTGPGERVLDGCGWGVNRESEFVFWFLPRLVRVLTAHQVIAPLTERTLVEAPPAAIVMDSRTVLYLTQVGLQPFVSSHYVALERAIWVPGMSGRLREREEKSWTVLVTGRYRLVESERQARHPWFFRAFDFPRNTVGPADRFVVDLPAEDRAAGERRVTWAVNGTEIALGAQGGMTLLERGGRLTARNGGGEVLAVFAVPERWSEILTMPCFPSWFEPSEEM